MLRLNQTSDLNTEVCFPMKNQRQDKLQRQHRGKKTRQKADVWLQNKRLLVLQGFSDVEAAERTRPCSVEKMTTWLS